MAWRDSGWRPGLLKLEGLGSTPELVWRPAKSSSGAATLVGAGRAARDELRMDVKHIEHVVFGAQHSSLRPPPPSAPPLHIIMGSSQWAAWCDCRAGGAILCDRIRLGFSA